MLESQLIHLNQIEFLIAAYRLEIVASLVWHLQLCVLLVLQLLRNKFLHRQQQTQPVFFLSVKQVPPVVNLHRRVRVLAQKLQTPNAVRLLNKIKQILYLQCRQWFLHEQRVVV